MNDSHAAALKAWLAARRDAQTRFLTELVKVPSDNPPGDCAAHAQRTAQLLEGLGFSVERHPVPEDTVKANGMISCTNLVVRQKFGTGGPTIALNAHGDVVPPGLGWSTDPYGGEVREGKMYGRGVAVSKSDFATYAYALLALRELKAPLNGAVELHFTYDEETGGEIGPKWLLDHKLSTPDLAIGAGFSYSITTAHNGCLHLEVEVIGKSGHAAMPERGIDALEAANAILTDLYEYRKALARIHSTIAGIGHPTLVVGLIEGGINTNVVPDRVVFRLDRRINPSEDAASAERELKQMIELSALRQAGISVNVRRVLLARPFIPLPGQERLVLALRNGARAAFGIELETGGVPIYTDARHYSEAGIPIVLYGCGPRTLEEANGHRADENIRLTDLYGATETVALALAELLGAA
ncbi:MAG: ArgE/DapE family deacylase [Betaproteobacteria bacterium]|nr:ArgE/DapE family deacylase [Betaproteobacteria bacterium]